jgi:uncharacterized oligopeptide transporter (OPT) family protein
MLWVLDPGGWTFATIYSGLELILDVLSLLGGTSFSAIVPSVVVSAAVLIYCLWPGTRDQFETTRVQSTLTGAGTGSGGAA